MTRLTIWIGILFSATVLSACGGSSEPEITTTQQVVDHFREQTGESLIIDSRFSDESVDQLDLGGTNSNGGLTSAGYRLASDYGVFSIEVYKDQDDAEEAVSDALEDDKDIEVTASSEPDENGNYWTETCYLFISPDECAYSASKLYGSNVVLNWQGGRKQEVDPSWDRLNTSLKGLFE